MRFKSTVVSKKYDDRIIKGEFLKVNDLILGTQLSAEGSEQKKEKLHLIS